MLQLSILNQLTGFLNGFVARIPDFSGFQKFIKLSSFQSCFWNMLAFRFFKLFSGFPGFFSDFSGFFRIFRIFFKSSNFEILFRDYVINRLHVIFIYYVYDRFFRNLSVFRIFLGILEIYFFYFLSNSLADGIRFYSVLVFFQIQI